LAEKTYLLFDSDVIGNYRDTRLIRNDFLISRVYEWEPFSDEDQIVKWRNEFNKSKRERSNLSNLFSRKNLSKNEANLLLYLLGFVSYKSNFIYDFKRDTMLTIRHIADDFRCSKEDAQILMERLYRKNIVGYIETGKKKMYILNPIAFPAHQKYSSWLRANFLYLATTLDESYDKFCRESAEYQEWRRYVFERDNYSCIACGSTDTTLHAHHILNYASNPTLRVDVDNGVTLCENCHVEFHKTFGNRNNDQRQLDEFIKYKSAV
jgi:hypothetical protein